MAQGARLKPEHFKLETKMENMAFRPFGELPPIRKGVGGVSINGMQIYAELESGKVPDAGDGKANIQAANFRMADFAAPKKRGETTLTLDGSAEAVATILEARPLRVMERMKVTADQFKGKAHADIVAQFPIGPECKISRCRLERAA